jgi:hypothetical protein
MRTRSLSRRMTSTWAPGASRRNARRASAGIVMVPLRDCTATNPRLRSTPHNTAISDSRITEIQKSRNSTSLANPPSPPIPAAPSLVPGLPNPTPRCPAPYHHAAPAPGPPEQPSPPMPSAVAPPPYLVRGRRAMVPGPGSPAVPVWLIAPPLVPGLPNPATIPSAAAAVPVPCWRCPVPGARCPVPGARSVPGRCPVGARSVPGRCPSRSPEPVPGRASMLTLSVPSCTYPTFGDWCIWFGRCSVDDVVDFRFVVDFQDYGPSF